MEYKITPKALWECLQIMEIQYQKMKDCYEELERVLSMAAEDNRFRQDLKDMEEQLLELWKLRRILERVSLNSKKQEQKILERLEGKQIQKNPVSFGKITRKHLSGIMEELQIWIQ